MHRKMSTVLIFAQYLTGQSDRIPSTQWCSCMLFKKELLWVSFENNVQRGINLSLKYSERFWGLGATVLLAKEVLNPITGLESTP